MTRMNASPIISGTWLKPAIGGIIMAITLAGCGPIKTENRVIIEQQKPIDVNLNINGNINININDARTDMKQITGQAPAREVKPEDIGLPAAPENKPGSMLPGNLLPTAPTALAVNDGSAPVLTLAIMDIGGAPTEAQLKDNISGRIPQVRYLLDEHVAGESHAGLLVPQKALTPQQQAILSAENADRAALYDLVAARKKTTVPEVALSFYIARLGYAKTGDIVEHYNRNTKDWEWMTWK